MAFLLFCRDEVTRTPDLYVPNVARYQLCYIPIVLWLQRYNIFCSFGTKSKKTATFVEIFAAIAQSVEH